MPRTFDHGYALLVGVGNHSHEYTLSLPTTVGDVQALRKTLAEPGLCAYPDSGDGAHIRALVNDQATNAGILDGLDWLRTRTARDKDATAFVYFSGHGLLSPAGDYFLATQDTRLGRAEATSLPAPVFTDALREVGARRLVVVLDCCHAQGMAAAKDVLGLDASLPKGLRRSAPDVSKVLAQGEGRAVFSASLGDEQSWLLLDGTLSVFTYHFIEALQGAGQRPGDTEVTLSSLMGYVSRTVPKTVAAQRQANQHPFFKMEAMDFPIALLRGGKGLPGGGWEAVQPEAQAYLAELARSVAVAVNVNVNTGSGSQATMGDVNAQGDVVVGTKKEEIHHHYYGAGRNARRAYAAANCLRRGSPTRRFARPILLPVRHAGARIRTRPDGWRDRRRHTDRARTGLDDLLPTQRAAGRTAPAHGESTPESARETGRDRDERATRARTNAGAGRTAPPTTDPKGGPPMGSENQSPGNVLKVGGKLKADRLTIGTHVEGADAQAAAELAKIQGNNRVELGEQSEAEIKDIVVGLRYIADPAAATPDDVRNEIADLRQRLNALLASEAVKDAGEAEDAQDALRKAEEAMNKSDGKRATGKLEEAAGYLGRLGNLVGQATELGAKLGGFAGAIGGLVEIGRRLFGG